jgi:hypothetical protein
MTRSRLQARLRRVAEAAEGAIEAAPAPGGAAASEAGPLANEVAAAFGRLARSYREVYGQSPEEARASTRANPGHPEYLERQLNGPPDQVEWYDLDELSRRDPALGLRRWEGVKQAAREEVATRFRAAAALEGPDSRCWDRARFLAVRAGLGDAWRARDAQEWALIDQLAQWQLLLWRSLETMNTYAALAAKGGKRSNKGSEGEYEPPRLSWAEAQERAAREAERLHRLYLRTLRALQDHRRMRSPVVVRRAGQVNIGQQQVNVAGQGPG